MKLGVDPAPVIGAFGSGQVWLSLSVTTPGVGGMFGAFTYIAYTLTEVSGFAFSSVPWLLIPFGGGLTITASLGYTSPLWIGAAMSAAALLVLVVADRAARRDVGDVHERIPGVDQRLLGASDHDAGAVGVHQS